MFLSLLRSVGLPDSGTLVFGTLARGCQLHDQKAMHVCLPPEQVFCKRKNCVGIAYPQARGKRIVNLAMQMGSTLFDNEVQARRDMGLGTDDESEDIESDEGENHAYFYDEDDVPERVCASHAIRDYAGDICWKLQLENEQQPLGLLEY